MPNAPYLSPADAVKWTEEALQRGGTRPTDPSSWGKRAYVIAADEHGIPHSTMRNSLAAAAREGMQPDWNLYQRKVSEMPQTPELPAPPEPPPEDDRRAQADQRRIQSLQDENAELRRKLRDALRDSIETEAIREILGGITAAAANPPKWLIKADSTKIDAEVPITVWSDWHAGERISFAETNGVNEFDTEILERRVHRLVERTIMLCRKHGPGNYPGAVINLIGDFCSGGLHPELLKTDEEEMIPSALRARDLLVWAIDEMARYFGNLYIPCASGNHGRNTQKPEFKRYVFKNFDWLIYQLLARHFAGRPEIVFDIPENNEVLYRVYNQRYLAMHGDHLGVKGGDGIIGLLGPLARGEMKVSKQSAAFGRSFDVLIVGHWHQPLWLNRVIVNGALKGWDEYAYKVLRAPPQAPSQSLWFVHPKWGRTAHREIFLEDPIVDENQSWISKLAS